MYVCVRACVRACVSYQIRVPAKKHMCQTSVNLMPCCIKHTQSPFGTKVPRLEVCRSIILLSKIAHQMWRDYPHSQRKSSGDGLGGDREGRGDWTKFEKRAEGGRSS